MVDEAEGIQFSYLGLSVNSGLHLIEESRWGESLYHVVSSATGNQIQVWNRPIASVNGQYIFTKQSDSFRLFEDLPLGFEIFSTDSLIKLESVTFENYYVTESTWLNDGSLIFKLALVELENEHAKTLNFRIIPIQQPVKGSLNN